MNWEMAEGFINVGVSMVMVAIGMGAMLGVLACTLALVRWWQR